MTIRRFDHAVIAARDLAAAVARYREVLGFDAREGGRHTGQGTYNGLIRFGADYLELLSIYDAAEAAASPAGQPFVDYLRHREGGLVGFSLAVEGIDELAERVRRAGLPAVGPLAMERARPDGRVLGWRILLLGDVPWRRPWPFFIEWATPDEERLTWEPPGNHPNGVTGVAGVAVAVRDLAAVRTVYQDVFDLTLEREADLPELGARRARLRVGTLTVDLLGAIGPGPVQAELDTDGEGPFHVTLRAASVERARARLEQSGVLSTPAPGVSSGWLLPPEHGLGARLVLVER